MKVLIVDDERAARDRMERLVLEASKDANIVGKAANVQEAHEIILKDYPDIVFLDIEMPRENGFELLNKFDQINFAVVFVTAYDEYAIKAIKFSALDYILKPIDREMLENAIGKFQSQKLSGVDCDLKELIENLANKKRPKLTVRLSGKTIFVDVADIVRFEAERNYTWIYLSDANKVIIPKTLKEYEMMLEDEGFFRSHRSHLVNLSFVKELNADENIVLMDNSEIELSIRKKQAFFRIMETISN